MDRTQFFEQILSDIRFDAQGLIPVVVQHAATNQVLLLAYVNREALEQTLTTQEAYFWSRSRQHLWHKGETSGHFLQVRSLHINCEENSLLLRVIPVDAGVCHDGYATCFYRQAGEDDSWQITEQKVFDPAQVYAKLDDVQLQHSELEQILRALYAGYMRLRDEDFTSVSGTSRLLRTGAQSGEQLIARAEIELDELRGVLAGTHRHTDTVSDVILEASQAHYWLTLAALRDDLSYEDWSPHHALSNGYINAEDTEHMQQQSSDASTGQIQARLQTIGIQIGRLIQQAHVAITTPFASDLQQLQQRLRNISHSPLSSTIPPHANDGHPP